MGATQMSDREVGSPVGPCPLTECAITVYVREARAAHDAVSKASVSVVDGPGPKDTDNLGFADFKGVKEPNKEWTVKVDLRRWAKKYAWDESDEATSQQTKYIPGGIDKFYLFEVIRRAWPIVEVMWWDEKEKKPDPSQKISGVGVKLKGPTGAAKDFDLGKTGADGRAKWKTSETGLRGGGYDVTFDFKGTAAEKYCEVVEQQKIDVPDGCNFSSPPDQEIVFPFSVRKYWYHFQVKDQFDQPVSGLDYMLIFPTDSGEATKKAQLADEGKVNAPGPKGGYKFAVKILSQPKWEYTPLEIDKEVEVSFQATGFDKDTEITVGIFDACNLSGDALDTLTPSPKTGTTSDVKAKWTPKADKLKDVKSGAVVFIAKSGDGLGKSVISPPAVVQEKQVFEVKDDKGAVMPGTTLVLAFEQDYQLGEYQQKQSNGQGKVEVMVPLGRRVVSVMLPGEAGGRASFKSEDDSEKREFLIPLAG